MEQSKFYQIKNVTEHEYTLVCCDGSVITRPIQDIDKSASVFTIQDAKPGDVLACPNDAGDRDVVFIFKNINSDEGWVFCFCASDANGCFCTNNDYVGNSNSTNISPATKEQRDLLFQKMHEEGYEWDAIHAKYDKSTWSEKDESYYNSALWHIKNSCGKEGIVYHWFKSLKDRVQPKQEWSELDRKIIIELIGIFESAVDGGHVSFPYRLIKDYIRVLKSCLPQSQWKPSDEQMKQLGWTAEQNKDNMIGKELMTLYQDLKKLMEE